MSRDIVDTSASGEGPPRRTHRPGELGIKYLTSRPYHPQTCGKIERFHQTLKKRLPAPPRAHTIAELQYQLDDFLAYYNRIRPHRAIGRHTPSKRLTPAPEPFPPATASPRLPGTPRPHRRRRRHHHSLPQPLHHIGLSKHLRGTNVIVLIDDLNIRVLNHNTGTLIRKLVLDPTRDHQPAASSAETHPKTESRCQPWLGTPVNDVPTGLAREPLGSPDRA